MASQLPSLDDIMHSILHGDETSKNIAFEKILFYGKEAVPYLISLLSSTDEQIRDSAVWALCELHEYSTSFLLQELSNPNPQIREQATLCVGILKIHSATNKLIHLLKDQFEQIRDTAAWSLAKIGNEDDTCIKAIIECLDDESVLVKEKASWILEHIGDRAFEPLFKKMLSEPHNADRFIPILTKIGQSSTQLLIHSLSKDLTLEQRLAIITLLGKLKDPDSIPHLIPLINNQNREIVTGTIQALIDIGELSIEPLFAAINDGTVYPIDQLVSLFMHFRKLSVPKLIEMLNSRETTLKIFAARSLGILEDTRAIEPLIQRLHDPNYQVIETCARALSAFTTPLIIQPLKSLLLDENYPIIKSNVIYALSRSINADEAFELIKSFNNASLTVKKRLIQLAAFFPSDLSEEMLQQAIAIDDEDCKILAIQSLKRIGTEKSIECLRNAIINEISYISDEAREALKEIIDRKQRDFLQSSENDNYQ